MIQTEYLGSGSVVTLTVIDLGACFMNYAETLSAMLGKMIEPPDEAMSICNS